MTVRNNRQIAQSNIKLPIHLKDWAKEQAAMTFNHYQALLPSLLMKKRVVVNLQSLPATRK